MEAQTNQLVSSLYVGDLSPDVDEHDLQRHFQKHGRVTSVRVIREPHSRKSMRYGYVNFVSYQDAEKALKELNFSTLEGKAIRVNWSNRDPRSRKSGIGNLYIKNIHSDLNSKALHEAFSSFGPIESCKVTEDDYGISKGYGFVQFKNEAHAKEAIKKANGLEFQGKKLFVTDFVPANMRVNAKPADPSSFTNVFIKNFGSNWSDNDLLQKFSKFGKITSSLVIKGENGESKGFGFVNFETYESALAAVKEMHDTVLEGGSKLFVGRAMKRRERSAYLARERERKKKERYEDCRGRNLYVKNFDENFTEERLSQEFSKFGEIENVKIERDVNGRSKCFGYVCFKSEEDAERAHKGLGSHMVDGNPLYVSYHQSREDRRRSMEARVMPSAFRPQPIPLQPLHFVYSNGSIPMPYQIQPTPQPVPAHFHRFNSRGGGQGQMRMALPPVPMARFPFAVVPGSRPRGHAGANQPRGYQASASGGIRQHGHNQNYGGRATQVSVNQVVTESQNGKISRKDDKVGRVQKDESAFDRLHSLIQDFGAAGTIDTAMTDQLTDVTVQYLRDNPTYSTTDASLNQLVMDCYSQLIRE